MRVRQIAGATSRPERVRRAIQHGPKLAHEMFPRALVAKHARTSQREVLEVQAPQVRADIRSGAARSALAWIAAANRSTGTAHRSALASGRGARRSVPVMRIVVEPES